MSHAETLRKAIQKATKNGWDKFGWKKFQVVVGGIGLWDDGRNFANREDGELVSEFEVIFNRGFAEAFWGVDEIWRETKCTCGGRKHPLLDWEFQLQQMVLEEYPVKYLKKFL